jgi:hypothetical protein
VLARVIEFAEAEDARTFGVLDDDEREQIHALLRRVAEAGAAAQRPASPVRLRDVRMNLGNCAFRLGISAENDVPLTPNAD